MEENMYYVEVRDKSTGEVVMNFETPALPIMTISDDGNSVGFNDIQVFGYNKEDAFEDDCCDCNDCPIARECVAESVVGSSVAVIKDELNLAYIDNDREVLATTPIMPDIVNVENPNDRTVFVQFADSTKEVSHASENDEFNLETGVLICITKKLLADMDIFCSGSSAYNKIIKYALTKLNATKKAKQALKEKRKQELAKVAKVRRDSRLAKERQRENRIREMADAYKLAFEEVSKEAVSDFEKYMNDLAKELEAKEEANKKED